MTAQPHPEFLDMTLGFSLSAHSPTSLAELLGLHLNLALVLLFSKSLTISKDTGYLGVASPGDWEGGEGFTGTTFA